MENPATIVSNIALVAVGLVACYPVYYVIGLGISRGFHRGKQEHIKSILKTCKESPSGAR